MHRETWVLGHSPSIPEPRENWRRPGACTVCNDARERGPEVSGVGDLEGRPCGRHGMREEGRKDVRNGFIEEGNHRHSEYPELERDEHDVLSFGVANAGS